MVKILIASILVAYILFGCQWDSGNGGISSSTLKVSKVPKEKPQKSTLDTQSKNSKNSKDVAQSRKDNQRKLGDTSSADAEGIETIPWHSATNQFAPLVYVNESGNTKSKGKIKSKSKSKSNDETRTKDLTDSEVPTAESTIVNSTMESGLDGWMTISKAKSKNNESNKPSMVGLPAVTHQSESNTGPKAKRKNEIKPEFGTNLDDELDKISSFVEMDWGENSESASSIVPVWQKNTIKQEQDGHKPETNEQVTPAAAAELAASRHQNQRIYGADLLPKGFLRSSSLPERASPSYRPFNSMIGIGMPKEPWKNPAETRRLFGPGIIGKSTVRKKSELKQKLVAEESQQGNNKLYKLFDTTPLLRIPFETGAWGEEQNSTSAGDETEKQH